MPTPFACPSCKERLNTSHPALAGKVVRCPRCQTPCRVPASEEALTTAPAPARERGAGEERWEETPSIRKSRSSLGLLIGIGAGVWLLLLAGAGVLAFVWLRGPASPVVSPAAPGPEVLRSRPAPVGGQPGEHQLRFAGRSHVRLANTRGLLDLNRPFTIEMWVRLRAAGPGLDYLAGDEAWPGMSPHVGVNTRSAGWALRTRPRPAGLDLDFTIASPAAGPGQEWHVVTSQSPAPAAGRWMHVAVSRSPGLIRLYRDGLLRAVRSDQNRTFIRSGTDLFLGVRKDAFTDRQFNGDIRAFRLCAAALYPENFDPPEQFTSHPDDLILLDFPGEGPTLRDLSGNGHHGTIVGARWQRE